jgi:nicotinate-nucleotide pyrophosphorylase (carboxylating)
MNLDINKIRPIIELALKEDIGSGDITSENLFPDNQIIKAKIISRQQGILCGLDVIKILYEIVNKDIRLISNFKDGDKIKENSISTIVKGPVKDILSTERTVLNFLGRLSGIATLTNQYVERVKDYKTKILDTRKTTPCLRYLEKYAVRCGGAINHRMGLYDMVIIKDNHIEIAGSIKNAVKKIREKIGKDILVEVEAETLEQVKEILETDANWIMLDNMELETIKKAVKLINNKKIIELSGGIILENIDEIAETGPDYISVGALTHSVKSLNFSMEIKKLN